MGLFVKKPAPTCRGGVFLYNIKGINFEQNP